MDNTLELLKSLTQGVNNKVNQEQKSYEYIVNTSLKNKNKKSTPPIVKEVITEKKEEIVEIEEPEIVYDFVEDTEIIDEIIGDEIIEEPIIEGYTDTEDIIFDINTDSELVEDGFIGDEIIADEVIEEPVVDDEIFIDIDSVVDESYIDGVDEVVVDTIDDSSDITISDGADKKIETDIVSDVGHISEDLSVTKKEAQKIQRNGNPFKRGPRKKKNKEVIVESPVEIPKDIDVLDSIENSNEVKEPDFDISNDIVDNSSVLELNAEEDTLEEVDLQFLDDAEFSELFKDDEDDDTFVSDSSISLDDDSDVLDSSMDDSDGFIGIEDDDIFNDASAKEPEIEEVEDVVDTISMEEPIVEPKIEPIIESKIESIIKSKVVEKENSHPVEPEVIEPVTEEEINVPMPTDKEETVVSEDDKFKDCKYYKGMDVEDFLRENPNYREAMYVEHFYSKEYLNKMIVSGLLLMKKGKYRF